MTEIKQGVPVLRTDAGQLDPFFDLAIDLLAVAGLDGCFHRMSRGVTEILGYRAEELVGRAVLDFVPSQERDRTWNMFGRLATGETVRDFEVPFLHRDGTYRWLSWNASAPVGEGMTYMVGRDITAGHAAEQRLRESQERFELAVRGASDGLWDWIDLRTAAQWWSPRFYEMLGLENGEGEASAERFLEMVHPQERSGAEEALQEHLHEGRAFDMTCKVRVKGGGYRRYRVRGAATRNAAGVPVRMSGSLSDVTDELETLDKLRRSEKQLRATGALAKVGGWEIDAETLEPSWSPEVARIHGVSSGEQPDLTECLDFYGPEARSLMQFAIERALEDGAPWDLELPLITADRQRIWVRSQGCADLENGRVTRIHAALQDITAQKQAEEQVTQTLEEVEESRTRMERQAVQLVRQAAELALARESAENASRMKGAFLATMSHEIRTPMNGVLGMVSLLDGTSLSEEQREYLDTIRVSGESLLEIINHVLDFSKTEAGKTRFAEAPFELARCCEEAADMLAAKTAAKRLDLSVFVSPACPVELRGDPGRLRQVMVNLIGNAIKFTEAGFAALRVEPVRSSEGLLRFEVRDTGIGISRRALPTLFQPFTQADSGTTRRFGGTGLGLAICKQIVEALGGRIGAFSDPGEGSTFWFELDLPVLKAASAADAAELKAVRVVMLVRSPGLKDSLERYFTAWGAHLSAVESIEAADRELRASTSACLAICETGSPHGFAVEELAALVGRHQGLRLAVASWPGAKEIDQARARGVEVLYRPVKRGRLLSWAAGRGSRQETRESVVASQGGLRVLVAEDNPVNQRIAWKMLERLGHDATVAVNGREALERARAEAFDLILMDCQMPEMDGFQAAREIRRLSPTPPIVALTANALEGDRQRCLDAGMDDYLPKPIDLKALGEMIECWRRPATAPDPV